MDDDDEALRKDPSSGIVVCPVARAKAFFADRPQNDVVVISMSDKMDDVEDEPTGSAFWWLTMLVVVSGFWGDDACFGCRGTVSIISPTPPFGLSNIG
jgi:hypothetical protein